MRLLHDYAGRHEVKVVAYCLMPNHVHLVVVPSTASGLHQALKAIHGQYAQRINRVQELKGHLWQGRFFSSALDTNYFRNAVRYVELNPFQAGLVRKAEEYHWSSAAAHCGLRHDPLIEGRPPSIAFNDIANWSDWLSAGLSQEASELLRRNIRKNLPCGSESFVENLERISGRRLRHKPSGRRSEVLGPASGQAQIQLEELGNVPS